MAAGARCEALPVLLRLYALLRRIAKRSAGCGVARKLGAGCESQAVVRTRTLAGATGCAAPSLLHLQHSHSRSNQHAHKPGVHSFDPALQLCTAGSIARENQHNRSKPCQRLKARQTVVQQLTSDARMCQLCISVAARYLHGLDAAAVVTRQMRTLQCSAAATG